eukprot:Ihof_evm3s1 gene=Ihof_evmTU3s1
MFTNASHALKRQSRTLSKAVIFRRCLTNSLGKDRPTITQRLTTARRLAHNIANSVRPPTSPKRSIFVTALTLTTCVSVVGFMGTVAYLKTHDNKDNAFRAAFKEYIPGAQTLCDLIDDYPPFAPFPRLAKPMPPGLSLPSLSSTPLNDPLISLDPLNIQSNDSDSMDSTAEDRKDGFIDPMGPENGTSLAATSLISDVDGKEQVKESELVIGQDSTQDEGVTEGEEVTDILESSAITAESVGKEVGIIADDVESDSLSVDKEHDSKEAELETEIKENTENILVEEKIKKIEDEIDTQMNEIIAPATTEEISKDMVETVDAKQPHVVEADQVPDTNNEDGSINAPHPEETGEDMSVIVTGLTEEVKRLYQQLHHQEEKATQAMTAALEKKDRQLTAQLKKSLAVLQVQADLLLAEERQLSSVRLEEEKATLISKHNEELLQTERRLERLYDGYYRQTLEVERKKYIDANSKDIALLVSRERIQAMLALETLYLRLKEIQRLLQGHVQSTNNNQHIHRLWATRALIEEAGNTGKPLHITRDKLCRHNDDPLVKVAVAQLPQSIFDTGIASFHDLHNQFSSLRKEARRAALLPEDGGNLMSYVMACIVDMVTFRRQPSQLSADIGKGPSTHEETDQIMALAEHSLKDKDLEM